MFNLHAASTVIKNNKSFSPWRSQRVLDRELEKACWPHLPVPIDSIHSLLHSLCSALYNIVCAKTECTAAVSCILFFYFRLHNCLGYCKSKVVCEQGKYRYCFLAFTQPFPVQAFIARGNTQRIRYTEVSCASGFQWQKGVGFSLTAGCFPDTEAWNLSLLPCFTECHAPFL